MHKNYNHNYPPSHPLSIDINNSSKSFTVGVTAVWYNSIPNAIVRKLHEEVNKNEICFSLSWSKYGDKAASINDIVNEFVRTVEYRTAMISKYKHERTLDIESTDTDVTIIVTFMVTDCY